MISRVIRKTVDLDAFQKVDQLEGPLYQLEESGHTFDITCMSGGTAAAVSGTVSGRFLRADETTVYFTGTLAGNVASITLPQSCYNVNGRFGLVVFISGNDVTSAIYAVAGNVYRSTSDTIIDPTGEIPSLEELMAQIEACEEATASAQQAASFVNSIIAPTYSTGVPYAIGDYCTYEGSMYRATAATSGEFDPSNLEMVLVGGEFSRLNEDVDDLKSAVDDISGVSLTLGTLESGAYTATVGETLVSTTGRHYKINCSAYIGKKVIVNFTTSSTVSVRATAMCDSSDVVGQAYQEKNMTAAGFEFDVTATYNILYISFDQTATSNVSAIVYGELNNIKADIDSCENRIGAVETQLSLDENRISAVENDIVKLNEKIVCGVEVPILSNPFGLKLFDIGGGKYTVNKRYDDFYTAAMDGIVWRTVYLDCVNGDNSNDGSYGHPVKSLSTALGLTGDNIRVIVPSGYYNALNDWISGTISDAGKNIIIECADGIFYQRYGQLASKRSWTETGSGVWQNTVASSPISIYDGTEYYAQKDTVQECTDTVKSYAYVSGVLYVHSSDNAKPSAQFMEFSYPALTVNLQTGKNLFVLHNVYFTDPTYSTGKSTITVKGNSSVTNYKTFIDNVQANKLTYSGYHEIYARSLHIDGTPGSAQDGITAAYPCKMWLEKCTVMNCGADGYNYHNNGSTGNPIVVELECVGLNCGTELTATINNCSTLHENFSAIRIGGAYYNSRDRAVHDVNTSKSFNAFCFVRQLKRDGNTTMDFSVGSVAADTVEMSIYNCNVDGSRSTYNVGVYAGTGNSVKCYGTNIQRTDDNAQIDLDWNPFSA